MRSSSAQASATTRIPRQQSFRSSLQRDAAIREYTTILPSPVLHAQYGAKSADHALSQLAANVGRNSNKAAETTIKLVYGALDVGVPVDVVLRVPETLISLIHARAGVPMPSIHGKSLHRLETRLQGQMDDLQAAYMCGEATTQDKVELRRRIKKMQKLLSDMDADLEREINEAIMPRDEVRKPQ